jgi:hypothetical protein
MNFNLPPDTAWQIASTTSQVIAAYAGPAELIGGILLTFLVVELIIGALTSSPTQGHTSG